MQKKKIQNAYKMAKEIYAVLLEEEFNGNKKLAQDFNLMLKNKKETKEHGYCSNAEASVTCEGCNLGDKVMYEKPPFDGRLKKNYPNYFAELYSDWLVCIYKN